jgi:16S rRNA (guanine527-N7)-methyltransferase
MVAGPDIIFKYFPDLSDLQKEQIKMLGPFYTEWNSKINMISRKDIESLYHRHILHSLAIAKYISFTDGTTVLDLGTGGGLPGIPLAIIFPDVQFLLVDGTAKKIGVVQELITTLKLDNAMALHKRAEELKMQFDFVLARAVTRLDRLLEFSLPLVHHNNRNRIPNGLITLKGGNLRDEIAEVSKQNDVEQINLMSLIEEEAFADKSILYVQA